MQIFRKNTLWEGCRLEHHKLWIKKRRERASTVPQDQVAFSASVRRKGTVLRIRRKLLRKGRFIRRPVNARSLRWDRRKLFLRSAKTKSGIPRKECRYFCRYGSHCPLNLVGTEASGTSVHMARSTVDNRLDPLDIGLPCTVGTSVRVGDLDTKSHALATVITLRHSLHLLSLITHK